MLHVKNHDERESDLDDGTKEPDKDTKTVHLLLGKRVSMIGSALEMLIDYKDIHEQSHEKTEYRPTPIRKASD